MIEIDFLYFFLYALSMLIVPAQWVLGWLSAAIIHEAGHVLALLLFKNRIYSVKIGVFGTKIETGTMGNLTEALCALAGPTAGIITYFSLRKLPCVALSGLAQSLFNLLPVFPLDGGRACRCLLLCLFTAEVTQRIVNTISVLLTILFLCLGAWISIKFKAGVIPIVFPTVPILTVIWKNSLQSGEKNSTIRRRTIQ